MAEKPPLRQVIKEWGEAADVWTKISARLGFVAIGVFKGQAVVDILQKLAG